MSVLHGTPTRDHSRFSYGVLILSTWPRMIEIHNQGVGISLSHKPKLVFRRTLSNCLAS